MKSPAISVVTCTLRRPQEVLEMLENLSQQEFFPKEVLLVDGAPAGENDTQEVVAKLDLSKLPFVLRYFRQTGGTAIQRNYGIDRVTGDFVAFVDDDMRLEPGYFRHIMEVYATDEKKEIGGITGFRTNHSFRMQDRARWRWYKRLRLLTTYDPGRYDFKTGYPINANMQAPFTGIKEVDFMSTSNAVWRREVVAPGHRFHPFFVGYGVLEDAHFSLKAKTKFGWRLLQCGDAHCRELSSPRGREDHKKVGFKIVINYYFVFKDICQPLSMAQKRRFFTYQAVELVRISGAFLKSREKRLSSELVGRLQGLWHVATKGV